MSAKSRIEWTERTWNVSAGCTKKSPGCKNCYAESMAARLQAMGAPGYENGFDLTLLPNRLGETSRQTKPTVYFVNSMSDVFHEEIPDSYIDQIFEAIRMTPQHTYQVLTKRADRLENFFRTREVPGNAWIGVSVEDRKHGVPRIDHLRKVQARVRFLSVEPLLEDLGRLNLDGIHWVIVGGESGPRARRMHLQWVDSVLAACAEQSVLFFFKQWGAWGVDGVRRAKRANGRLLRGRVWDEMPEIGRGGAEGLASGIAKRGVAPELAEY